MNKLGSFGQVEALLCACSAAYTTARKFLDSIQISLKNALSTAIEYIAKYLNGQHDVQLPLAEVEIESGELEVDSTQRSIKIKYDDVLTSSFGRFISTNQYQKAYDLVSDAKNLNEIRGQCLTACIDHLVDNNAFSQCFSFLKLLICHRPSVLTKYTVKKLFRISLRAGYKASSIEMIAALETRLDLSEHVDLYFRMNQYLLGALLKNGDYSTASDLFGKLKHMSPYDADQNAALYYKLYEILIKGCLSKIVNRMDDAKTFLSEIAQRKPNDVFFNKIIDFSAKKNEIGFAEYVFKIMVSNGIQPSIVTYNTLIDSYFRQNRFNQAWIIFDLLKKSDKRPDNFTYTTMINGIKSMNPPDVERAFILFAEYKQVNRPDQIIYNCLLDACINANDLNRAHQLLIEMKQDQNIQLDEITYNTLIKGCCRSKKTSQAIAYYQEMKSKNIRPNRITYNTLIDNCVKAKKMRDAWRFYEEMTSACITPDNFTYSILINGIKSNHTNKDELNRALELLDAMQSNAEFKPDEILYNSLIDACIKFNEINRGLRLYEEMKKKRITPSSITYGILIKAYGKQNELSKAFQLFEQMKAQKMKLNDVTYGCLLDACVKNDRMDLTSVLVNKMKQDNIVLNTILYTTMIKGFSKSGDLEEALHIFKVMKESPKAQPSLITYNCIIDACVKNENIMKANELFEELYYKNSAIRPDLITFSTIIKGFCRRKDNDRAYHYMKLMQHSGTKPDEPLLNLILDCCYNTNNCKLAMEVFDLMIQLKVYPSHITFSILMKIYGKSRKLDKAIEVVSLMRANRIKPSLITFTNLIQACFKANRPDKVLEVLQEVGKENLRWDAIFYAKIISGFVSFKMIDIAAQYYKKATTCSIVLSQEIPNQLYEELALSNLPNKQQLIKEFHYPESTSWEKPSALHVSHRKNNDGFDADMSENKENYNTTNCTQHHNTQPFKKAKGFSKRVSNPQNYGFQGQSSTQAMSGPFKVDPLMSILKECSTESNVLIQPPTHSAKKSLNLNNKEFFMGQRNESMLPSNFL